MFFLPGIGGWEGGSGLGARPGTGGQQEAQRRQPSNMDARSAHLPNSSTEAGGGAAVSGPVPSEWFVRKSERLLECAQGLRDDQQWS